MVTERPDPAGPGTFLQLSLFEGEAMGESVDEPVVAPPPPAPDAADAAIDGVGTPQNPDENSVSSSPAEPGDSTPDQPPAAEPEPTAHAEPAVSPVPNPDKPAVPAEEEKTEPQGDVAPGNDQAAPEPEITAPAPENPPAEPETEPQPAAMEQGSSTPSPQEPAPQTTSEPPMEPVPGGPGVQITSAESEPQPEAVAAVDEPLPSVPVTAVEPPRNDDIQSTGQDQPDADQPSDDQGSEAVAQPAEPADTGESREVAESPTASENVVEGEGEEPVVEAVQEEEAQEMPQVRVQEPQERQDEKKPDAAHESKEQKEQVDAPTAPVAAPIEPVRDTSKSAEYKSAGNASGPSPGIPPRHAVFENEKKTTQGTGSAAPEAAHRPVHGSATPRTVRDAPKRKADPDERLVKPKSKEEPSVPPRKQAKPQGKPTPSRKDVLQEALASAKDRAHRDALKEALESARTSKESREFMEGRGEGNGGGLRDVYAVAVVQAVRPNWSMPAFAKKRITVSIRVKIAPDGRVLSAQIVSKSSRPEFDASAVNAILRTRVLPPPPSPDLRDIVIRFNSRLAKSMER